MSVKADKQTHGGGAAHLFGPAASVTSAFNTFSHSAHPRFPVENRNLDTSHTQPTSVFCLHSILRATLV